MFSESLLQRWQECGEEAAVMGRDRGGGERGGEAVDGSWVCPESRADSFAAEGSDVGDETKESRRDDSEILT